jgi:hypothetical protein
MSIDEIVKKSITLFTKDKMKTKIIIWLAIALIVSIAFNFLIYNYLQPPPEVTVTDSFEFDGQADAVKDAVNVEVTGKAEPQIYEPKPDTVGIIKKFTKYILPKPDAVTDAVKLKTFPAYLAIGKRQIFENYRKKEQIKRKGDVTVTLNGTFNAYGKYNDVITIDTIKRQYAKPRWIRLKVGAGYYSRTTGDILSTALGVNLFNRIDIMAGAILIGRESCLGCQVNWTF